MIFFVVIFDLSSGDIDLNSTPIPKQGMAAHRRTTSDSNTAVFVPHSLSFAGAGDEEDKYFAAQRYDWDDVPPKLTEPRALYEPTQPFDYVVPKRGRRVQGRALSVSNGDPGAGAGTEGIVKKRAHRLRRDEESEQQSFGMKSSAELVTLDSPAVSVEPEGGARHLPKRRGRPARRSETGRKTDDGDNTEDVGFNTKIILKNLANSYLS
jgi:hypothetical protein